MGGGIGKSSIPTAIVTFKDFAFDEEKISSPTIPVADLFAKDKVIPLGTYAPEDPLRFPDMILGADFFLAHRVLISKSQHKVYITYNGAELFPHDPAAQAEKAGRTSE